MISIVTLTPNSYLLTPISRHNQARREPLQVRPDVGGYDSGAGSIRMNHVALQQLFVAKDALQEERHERHTIPFRERRKDPVKVERVLPSEQWQRLHGTEQHRHPTRLRRL